jgi:hypothetical protein
MRFLRLQLILAIASFAAPVSRPLGDTQVPAQSSDLPFQRELLQVAADYKQWGRVDDDMRWAPELCRRPNPGQAHVSASQDEQTHGRKLYSLFARKRDAYYRLERRKLSDIGQVIVKQSWVPEEITDSKERPGKRVDHSRIVRTPNSAPGRKPGALDTDGDHFYPYVWKGEKVFKASKQADLFIMMKLGPNRSGTDAGWVYGTVTSDGKKVTAAGRIESCMKCHQEAKNERLFGLRLLE